MTKESPNNNHQTAETSPERVFDLEERTGRFGEQIVDFAGAIRLTPITEPLVSQLIRSGTSIGANYCEANDAGSKREFRHRISLCRREAKETKHWLRMITRTNGDLQSTARPLWQEAHELTLIFSSIHRKLSV